MLNHIVLMGRLTRDPELRRTGSGIPVASFSIACERDYKPESGERETDFIDIVAWRNTAEFVSKYFTKGRMAVVSGRLQIRGWTDNQGNKRRSAEIVADSVYFGDSRPEGQSTGQSYGGFVPQAPSQTSRPAAPAGYSSSGPGGYGGQQQFPTAPPVFTPEKGEDEHLPF